VGEVQNTVPFLGRFRSFPTGLFRLARLRNAEVIPAAAWYEPSGRQVLAFLNPLVGDTEEQLLLSYRDRLEQLWLAHPESIPLKQIRDFLKSPRESARFLHKF
jgi:lauroyl/myristoyl acyltransferase